MITKINKFALLLMMLCFTVSASAASEAEYKKLAKTWTLNADGSQEFRYKMELTLFTHAAMNSRYGESFIVYNPKYQTLKINESYTKQQDGTIIKTPDNAFVEVLPKNAADAPAYNHLKEMVVVHTGLELGATIYLDYTLTSKPGYLPELDIFEAIQHDSPIREYTLTMVTPSDKTLNYTLANNNTKPLVKENKGKHVTSWTLRNIPQLSTSAHVSISNGDLPFLAATTYASMKDAMQTLNQQLTLTANAEIQALANELKDKKCEKNQLKAISNYVIQNLSANRLNLEQTGYRFRPVSEVLSTLYGTEAEKANLFAALLNAAGFKAEIVAGYPVQAEKGLGLKAIDHLYVAVNGQQYIFAIGSTARPQQVYFAGAPLYKLSDGTQLTVKPSTEYKLVSNQKINVENGKFVTETQETVGTDLLPYFSKPEQVKEATNKLNIQNGYTTVVLNESEYSFSTLGCNRLNSTRNANLQLPRPVDETYSYTITYGKNMNLCNPVRNQEIHNAAGDLVISVQKEGQKATITRSLKLNKQLYTPSEYKALRLLLTAWSDVNARTLLFSVK